MDQATRQQAIETVVLDHIGGRGRDWATAKELALELGYPWRVVARTLTRLAIAKHIEQQNYEWRSKRQRLRTRYVYRMVVTVHVEYPAWLMPSRPTRN